MNINAAVAARRCTITSVDAGADVQQNIGDTITWTLDAEWAGLTVIAVVGFPRTRTYIELPIVGGVTQLPRLGADVITLGCYAGDGSSALRSSTSSRLALSRSVLSDRGTAEVINPADLGDMDTVSAADKLIVMRSEDGAVKRALVSALPSSGGGGAVDSVNGKIGAVVLDADDVNAVRYDAAQSLTEAQKATARGNIAAPYTTLEKNPSNGLGNNPVRVHLHGLTSEDVGAMIHVYYAVRRRERKFYWRHPDNYDATGADSSRFGYGQLVGDEYGDGSLIYDAVPAWMPNGGYLQSEFVLTADDILRGYLDIDISNWLLPLIKPKLNDGALSWDGLVGIVGLSTNGTHAPLLFRFHIVQSGGSIGESRDMLCLGLRNKWDPSRTAWQRGNDNINECIMYVSIR